MYDAPAFGTAVPDECAAPTTQHIAIRAAPKDRKRADGDFTEAVDAVTLRTLKGAVLTRVGHWPG